MPEMDGYEPGAPCWVDMGTTDVQAAGAFYSALLGWDVQYGPEEMGHYSMARINGRDVAAIADQQVPGMVVWSTYLATDDVDATAERVRAAGGTLLVEPMDVMTFGRMAVALDTGGAAISFWQPGDHKGAGLYDEPGAVCWNELMTRAAKESLEFYEAVAGLTARRMEGGHGDYYELSLPSGRTVAGLMPIDDSWGADIPNYWGVYFAVGDTDATAARCTELGGTVALAPTDVPPGRFAVLDDPQGGHFMVLQRNADFRPGG